MEKGKNKVKFSKNSKIQVNSSQPSKGGNINQHQPQDQQYNTIAN